MRLGLRGSFIHRSEVEFGEAPIDERLAMRIDEAHAGYLELKFRRSLSVANVRCENKDAGDAD
jgi:hypothetical protein